MLLKESPPVDQETAVTIFGATPLSSVDGPGKRTVVFFQGCPQRCTWCHSPHSQQGRSPLLFHAQRCVVCARCAAACPNKVHSFDTSMHTLDASMHTLHRENCNQCGRCVEACPNSSLYSTSGALCLPTKTMTAVSLFAQLKPYLSVSSGLTLSGGEALIQPGTLPFLRICRDNGASVCVETSGLLPAPLYAAAAPYVNSWLFGARVLTDAQGCFHTNTLIANVHTLLKHPDCVILPILPLIPGITDRADVQRETLAVLRETGAATLRLNPWNPHYSLYYSASGIKPVFPAPSDENIHQCGEKTRAYFMANGFTIVQ